MIFCQRAAFLLDLGGWRSGDANLEVLLVRTFRRFTSASTFSASSSASSVATLELSWELGIANQSDRLSDHVTHKPSGLNDNDPVLRTEQESINRIQTKRNYNPLVTGLNQQAPISPSAVWWILAKIYILPPNRTSRTYPTTRSTIA